MGFDPTPLLKTLVNRLYKLIPNFYKPALAPFAESGDLYLLETEFLLFFVFPEVLRVPIEVFWEGWDNRQCWEQADRKLALGQQHSEEPGEVK